MPQTAQTETRTAASIRRSFLDYFRDRHGHTFAPSSPVVPHDDPTLLFTNAGMNQFKDVFLGQGKRDYNRAVNTQKCIRAGGKHNDLEDVGKDTYHHTFFEMLGNWSFGDYFKAEAIEWAWDLLTNVWGLDPDRLYVTVFEGDDGDGLEADTEAEELWKRHVPADRISRWDKKDNFWEMGDTGPCGPCSEIHYDNTPDKSGGDKVNADHPDVIEIWNLVFIQFNRGSDGALTPLPAKHVDTGMGFERIVRVMQGKQSNYDTDLWTPIFEAIRQKTKAREYRGVLDDPIDIAYRVIADHIRCLAVAITDGAMPGNEGRGYVLRRILRRAVRHAYQTLGMEQPVLCELVDSVVESLGEAFPELREKAGHVRKIVRSEEEAFLRTLEHGIRLFDSACSRAIGFAYAESEGWTFDSQLEEADKFNLGFRDANGEFKTIQVPVESIPNFVRECKITPQISAQSAFKLHDTYGFPIDLTQVMAEERGMTVDVEGFHEMMEQARQTSRQKSGDGETAITIPPEALARLEAHLGVEATDDSDKYVTLLSPARIQAVWDGSNFEDRVPVTTKGQHVAVITDRTCFYAEAGGQIGDTGRIEKPGGSIEFRVHDTQRVGEYVLHIGRLTSGSLHVGDEVEMNVDADRRAMIRANHTGTHLLNHALRQVINDESIDQRGSLVADDRLRFDFTCHEALSDTQINGVERLVNAAIHMDLPVNAGVVELETGRSINGLRAVFGERYPDPVRVVSIGPTIEQLTANPDDARWSEFSVEFCGGTHLDSTKQAKKFVITSEGALSAGVRRMAALTGAAAIAADAAGKDLESRAYRAQSLKGDEFIDEINEVTRLAENLTISLVSRHKVEQRLAPLRDKAKAMRKEAETTARKQAVEQARVIAENIHGRIIVDELANAADRDALLAAMDVLKAHRPEAAVMLLSGDADESKVVITAAVPKELIDTGLKAGDWVKHVASVCGGGGGGRPDSAQAGGKQPEKIPEAVEAAKSFAEDALK